MRLNFKYIIFSFLKICLFSPVRSNPKPTYVLEKKNFNRFDACHLEGSFLVSHDCEHLEEQLKNHNDKF